MTGKAEKINFNKEKYDVVRATWCIVIQRAKFDEFGKDVFSELMAKDKTILPQMEFAKEDLNKSENYRKWLYE